MPEDVEDDLLCLMHPPNIVNRHPQNLVNVSSSGEDCSALWIKLHSMDPAIYAHTGPRVVDWPLNEMMVYAYKI